MVGNEIAGGGGREKLYLTLHCHQQDSDFCSKMGSDESFFLFSFLVCLFFVFVVVVVFVFVVVVFVLFLFCFVLGGGLFF